MHKPLVIGTGSSEAEGLEVGSPLHGQEEFVDQAGDHDVIQQDGFEAEGGGEAGLEARRPPKQEATTCPVAGTCPCSRGPKNCEARLASGVSKATTGAGTRESVAARKEPFNKTMLLDEAGPLRQGPGLREGRLQETAGTQQRVATSSKAIAVLHHGRAPLKHAVSRPGKTSRPEARPTEHGAGGPGATNKSTQSTVGRRPGRTNSPGVDHRACGEALRQERGGPGTTCTDFQEIVIHSKGPRRHWLRLGFGFGSWLSSSKSSWSPEACRTTPFGPRTATSARQHPGGHECCRPQPGRARRQNNQPHS